MLIIRKKTTLKLCSNIAYITRPIPKDGSITLGMISSTWNVFWYFLTLTMSLVRVTGLPSTSMLASPPSRSASTLLICSRLSLANMSVTLLASFLKALPMAPYNQYNIFF